MSTDDLKNITAVIIALTALITAILGISQKLNDFWNKILWPVTKIVIFIATFVIPNGVIIWIFLDQAAKVPNRLSEQSVFNALLIQLVGLSSLFTVCWGWWVLPRIKSLIIKRNEVEKTNGT